VTSYTVDGRPVAAAEAVAEVAASLKKARGLAIVGSGKSSVEEFWMLKKIADTVPTGTKIKFVVPHTGEGDGLLISADRNPNTRGALLTGFADSIAAADLKAAVASGSVDTILSVNECVSALGLEGDALKKLNFISMGTHFCETSQYAHVEVPLLTIFEREGSFVNQQFRLQKFSRAVPGPQGVLADADFFAAVFVALGGKAQKVPGVAGVWSDIAASVAQFAGVSFAGIPADGLLVDGSAFANIAFVEGKTLHYSPAVKQGGAV
jgi:NADH-quinone oxidoreductase subunit G